MDLTPRLKTVRSEFLCKCVIFGLLIMRSPDIRSTQPPVDGKLTFGEWLGEDKYNALVQSFVDYLDDVYGGEYSGSLKSEG